MLLLFQEWKFELINPPVFVLEVKEKKSEDYHLVMFSSPSCGPCKIFVKSDKYKRIKEVYKIVQIDMVKEPIWHTKRGNLPAIEKYPTFWLVETKNPTLPPTVWVGDVTLEQIQKVLEPKPTYARQSSKRWNLDGDFSPSREKLAKHLKEEHNIDWDLSVLTYNELLAVHDDIHNGKLGLLQTK